jgi:hypothetical protein
MKQLILIFSLVLVTFWIWDTSGKDQIWRKYEVEQKTLDLSTPFSGTIDLEFLKELQRTQLESSTVMPDQL